MELLEYQRKMITNTLDKLSKYEIDLLLDRLSLTKKARDPYVFFNQIKGYLDCLRCNEKIDAVEHATFRQWAQYNTDELITEMLSRLEVVKK